MTRKQIDGAREIRLWVGQIVVPAVMLVAAMSPQSRENLKNSALTSVRKIRNKFKKGSLN